MSIDTVFEKTLELAQSQLSNYKKIVNPKYLPIIATILEEGLMKMGVLNDFDSYIEKCQHEMTVDQILEKAYELDVCLVFINEHHPSSLLNRSPTFVKQVRKHFGIE